MLANLQTVVNSGQWTYPTYLMNISCLWDIFIFSKEHHQINILLGKNGTAQTKNNLICWGKYSKLCVCISSKWSLLGYLETSAFFATNFEGNIYARLISWFLLVSTVWNLLAREISSRTVLIFIMCLRNCSCEVVDWFCLQFRGI